MDPDNTLTLFVTTPKGLDLEQKVSYVELPGSEGRLGILPHHRPLVSALEPGLLRYRAVAVGSQGGRSDASALESMAVDAGFVETEGGEVRVVTRAAVGAKKAKKGLGSDVSADEVALGRGALGQEAWASALQEAERELSSVASKGSQSGIEAGRRVAFLKAQGQVSGFTA